MQLYHNISLFHLHMSMHEKELNIFYFQLNKIMFKEIMMIRIVIFNGKLSSLLFLVQIKNCLG